ncbi:MAG TPA: NAD(P)/FAD-dependent oxidoreductase [Nitrososphaeraceae archaeon]|nr:NAD(P)/FAD-dependent oxidoreductase [Nitrososphaeraceae archaeon]
MKIAVVGIGVAGAYLMNRLSDAHDNHVVGFERLPETQHDAVCAWATCKNVMSGLVKNCGLNFEEYILHSGKHMKIDLGSIGSKNGEDDDNNNIDIRLKGMVSYDKLKLIQDMMKGTKIEFGKIPKKENLESEFDIVIDSTGFHRNYLPKLENDTWIPCIQYKVKYDIGKTPFDDFYLKAFPSMTGYFWYFPLGNGYAHIGAGDFERKKNNKFVDEFLNRHKCQVVKKVGRPVRITPPVNCEPFTDGRKSVGVGESIGTVYSLLGEGIIPATWCAELFIQHLHDIKSYREAVLKRFKIYTLVFKFIQLKIAGKFNMLRHVYDLLRIYNHMKSEEDRYGMQVKMINMMKVSRI